MKSTHTLQDIEGLLLEKVILLKTAETKEEKEKIRKQIHRLEKHFNDCNGKHLNGKNFGYTKQEPPKVSKKELLELIDSVEDYPKPVAMDIENLAGVFVTDPKTYTD